MAWSFVAAGAVGTGISPTAVLPTGHAAGDLLVIVGSSNGVFATPSGWTVGILNFNSTDTNLSLWYKIDSGSEVDVPSGKSTGNSSFGMMVYRGIADSPLDIAGYGDSSAGGNSVVTSSITTTKTNDLVISVFAHKKTSSTWTAPASTTRRLTQNGTGVIYGLLAVDENAASAGATTVRTASIPTSNFMSSFAIAFSQAVTGSISSAFFSFM